MVVRERGDIAFINDEATFAWEDPFISFLEADVASALSHLFDLWHEDMELEGTAVAVAMVGF